MDSRRQTPLRAALVGNGVFSSAAATVLLLAGTRVARFAGLPADFPVGILAWSLLLYAAWLFAGARRRELRLDNAWIAVILDAGWVIGSAFVVLLQPMAVEGRWLIAAVSAVVAVFAFAQWQGIRIVQRTSKEAGHA